MTEQIQEKNLLRFLKQILLSPRSIFQEPKKSQNWLFLAIFFFGLSIPFFYMATIPSFLERISPRLITICYTCCFTTLCLTCLSFSIALLAGVLWQNSIVSTIYSLLIFTLVFFFPLFIAILYLDAMVNWTYNGIFPEKSKFDFFIDSLLFLCDNIGECIFLDIPQIFGIHFCSYNLQTFVGKITTCFMRLAFDFSILSFIIEQLKIVWHKRSR